MPADLTANVPARPSTLWPEPVRGVIGATELVATDRVARWIGAEPADHRVRWIIRLLGARHVTQAVLTTLGRSRTGHGIGAAVDVLHGLSMVGLACVAPRLRRPALTSAALSGALAAVEAVHARG
jgi:hypothetical protein